jgi:hypothetical protein
MREIAKIYLSENILPTQKHGSRLSYQNKVAGYMKRSERKVKEKKEKLKASARVTLPEPTAWNEVSSRLRQLLRLT